MLLGDAKQLGSPEAGKPFAQLQAAGMQTARMDEILRQKRAPDLLAAVEHARDSRIADAFAKIETSVVELPREKQVEHLAKSYLALSKDRQDGTLVVVPSRELRRELNEAVRAGLKTQSGISGESYAGTQYVARDMTRVERGDARRYREGDIIRFNRTYKSLGVQSGEYYTVARSEQDRNVLELRGHSAGPDGQEPHTIKWNPYEVGGRRDGAVGVFERGDITLQQGDRIKITRTNKSTDLTNGDTFTVKAVLDDRVEMEGSAGEIRSFAKDDPDLCHIDYRYAQTAHGAQGMTFDNVLAIIDSNFKSLANQQLFYVTLSRARLGVELVVDNAHDLIKQLERVTGENLSALEVAGQHKDLYADQKSQREADPAREDGAGKDDHAANQQYVKSDGSASPSPNKDREPANLSLDL